MTLRLIGGRAGLATLSTVLVLSLSGPAYGVSDEPVADASVPEEIITVEVVAANGSGCAPGTARIIQQADKTGFRIRYTDFIAEAGGNADVIDRRKNCQVALLVTVPAGWTFAIASADYRGRARLDAGATGLQRTNYYLQGSSDNNYADHTFAGPRNDFWSTSDVAYALVYAKCSTQTIVNINTELRVDEGTSKKKSSLSMRSSEGDVDTLFNFSWKKC